MLSIYNMYITPTHILLDFSTLVLSILSFLGGANNRCFLKIASYLLHCKDHTIGVSLCFYGHMGTTVPLEINCVCNFVLIFCSIRVDLFSCM